MQQIDESVMAEVVDWLLDGMPLQKVRDKHAQLVLGHAPDAVKSLDRLHEALADAEVLAERRFREGSGHVDI